MKTPFSGAALTAATNFLAAVAFLVSVASLTGCGAPGVSLVNGTPLPEVTVVRTESEAVLGTTDLKTGIFNTIGKKRLLCEWELRPAGQLRVIPREDSRYAKLFGESTTHGALEGIALLGRKLDGRWQFSLERGTASKDQADALNEMMPPLFTFDRLYPASPVRIGDQWKLDPESVPVLIPLAAQMGPANAGLWSGTMTLTAVKEQNGEKVAAIGFSARYTYGSEPGKNLEIKGEIIRSLKSFLDISVTAGAEKPADSEKALRVTISLRQSILSGTQLQNTPSALAKDDAEAIKKKALEFLAKKQADLDTQIKQLEAKKRKLEWPPSAPVFSSADDWARKYQAAKWVSNQELLSDISSVELLVYPDSTLSSYYSKDQLFKLFKEAIESQGIRVQEGSSFKLVAECSLQESAIKLHQWSSNLGQIDNTFPVNIKFLGLKLVVTTPVLRGGHFYPLQVAPLCGWSANLGQGKDDPDFRSQNFQELVGDVLDAIRKGGPEENSEEDAWRKAAWSQGEDEKLCQEWVTAIGVGPPESEKCFINFPRIAKYDLDADETARSNLNWDEYAGQWRQILNDAQHTVSAADQIVFRNEVRSVRTGANVAVKRLLGFESSPYYSNLSAVRIYQANVVFPVSKNGQAPFLARRSALVFMGFTGSMCLPDDLEGNLQQVTRESMNDVAQQMRYKH